MRGPAGRRTARVVLAGMFGAFCLGAAGCAERPPGAQVRPVHLELSVLADDCYFVLSDGDRSSGEPPFRQMDRDHIGSGPGLVGISTARQTGVPVTIDVQAESPADDLERYDHVAEVSMETNGTILVTTAFGDTTTDPRIDVPAGTYRVRAHYQHVTAITFDGVDGEDSYHVVLWPDEPRPPAVLKRFAGDWPDC